MTCEHVWMNYYLSACNAQNEMNETASLPYTPRRGNLTGRTGDVPPERLKEALGWMQQAQLPMEMVIGVNASIWLLQVDRLREMEETFPVPDQESEREQMQRDHRQILHMLISDGEQFVYMAKHAKLEKFPPGFTTADLEATLETLHIAFKCQYRPDRNEKVSNAVQSLLDAA